MPHNRQFAINTIATALNLVINFGISFFLTSYLVRTIGSTTFGFWGLANNIVSYALIIFTALNSMAGRFIGIDYHRGDFRQASEYYSSVFVADFLFALIILVPSCAAIWYIDKLISVPPEIVREVKILFYIVFINMCCGVVFAVFGCVYVIKNRLDISATLSIISNVFKSLLLILLYWKLRPSIVYLGTATLCATVFFVISNIVFMKRLAPELKLHVQYSSFSSVKTIVSSGIWNSLNQLSVVLLQGLDLLIANLFVSAAAMGLISVAGMLPGVITTCIFSFAYVYAPNYLKLYSLNKYDELFREIKNSAKFMTVISCIPIGFLVGFGLPFYRLWTPDTDIQTVYYLSILIVLPLLSGGSLLSTNYLYTVADKVKWQALVLIFTGLLNVILVFIVLRLTSFGVYAIVGISAIMGFIRNIFFNAPLAAYCVNKNYTALWPDMMKSYACIMLCVSVCLIVNYLVELKTWISLIIVGGGTVLLSSYFVALLLLTSYQRSLIYSKIKSVFSNR